MEEEDGEMRRKKESRGGISGRLCRKQRERNGSYGGKLGKRKKRRGVGRGQRELGEWVGGKRKIIIIKRRTLKK